VSIAISQDMPTKSIEPNSLTFSNHTPVPQPPAAKVEEQPKPPKKLTFLHEHSAKLRARATAKMAARLNPAHQNCKNYSNSKAALGNNVSKDLIHFKFHEGCTVAVRRPVTIGFFIAQ
jgi:hypothetical protein